MTTFGNAIRRAYRRGAQEHLSDWCTFIGIPYDVVRGWMRSDTEPTWLRTLRTIRRRTGLTWDELLDGRVRPTAMRVTRRRDERGTVGTTTCSACGTTVNQHDRFCRHCGADFGEAEP